MRMNPRVFFFTALFVAVLTSPPVPSVAAPAPDVLPEVPADHVAKIRAALPSPAPAPETPRRILLFWRCEGFYHSAIPWANRAIQEMGAMNKAWTCAVSKDMAVFTPERLAEYDVVVFNSTTRLQPTDEQLQALLDFVRGGGGIVGIHAATDNFYSDPEAAQMMGGLFNKHPWHFKGMWSFVLDDPGHRLNQAFEELTFEASDEIYQFKDPYSRERVRVLTRVDLSQASNLEVQGRERDDLDHAITWVRSEGSGRVFYFGFGHNNAIYWNRPLMRHLYDGLRFAAGDLEVDTTPSAQRDDLDRIAGWAYEQSRMPFERLRIRWNEADDAGRAKLEDQFTEALRNTRSTLDGRREICRLLGHSGSERACAALAEALRHPDLRDEACIALGVHPSAEADAALVDFLADSGDAHAISVINAAGRRRVNAAVPQLARRLASEDEALVKASSYALATIASPPAIETLMEAYTAEENSILEPALLDAAYRLAEAGSAENARRLFEGLTGRGSPQSRAAALPGLVSLRGREMIPDLFKALREGSDPVAETAARILPELLTPSTVRPLARTLDSLPDDRVPMALEVLARVAPDETLPILRSMLDTDEPSSASMALAIIGRFGEREDLARCFDWAAHEDEGASGPAREVLSYDHLPGTDKFLLKKLDPDTAPEDTALAIELLSKREHPELLDRLRDPAWYDDHITASAALNALKEHATRDDLGPVIQLFFAVNNRTAPKLAGVIRKIAQEYKDQKAVLDGYRRALDHAREMHSTARMRILMQLVDYLDIPAHLKGEAWMALIRECEDKALRLEAIQLLARSAPSASALDFISGLHGDADLTAVIERAHRSIEKALSGPPELTASHGGGTLKALFTPETEDRWTSHQSREPGMWLLIDFRVPRRVGSITLDASGSKNDFPNQYEVYTDDEQEASAAPRLRGEGSTVTKIDLGGVETQFVKIVNQSEAHQWWSIHDLRIDGESLSSMKNHDAGK
ncbi:ThuA domain-containing protein [Kiritimatiella glycovorans]|uniref:Trehalose utilization n=1 Tax=Kiritimatiella glycovorans TaxID=1307763 RepID=A0A0G3EHW4_9BACT|nr:ThuA domain-containing protein [Kiritimatiella glycovorans]AKJ64395.1 hypothetical protein L21SP4_01145 [Kiritimatiella glycovorans]